eukprot:36582_1
MLIIQKKKLEDKIIINNTNKVFEHGSHEWIIKIRKCDIYTQEISVIGANKVDKMGVIDGGGIKFKFILITVLCHRAFYYYYFKTKVCSIDEDEKLTEEPQNGYNNTLSSKNTKQKK